MNIEKNQKIFMHFCSAIDDMLEELKINIQAGEDPIKLITDIQESLSALLAAKDM